MKNLCTLGSSFGCFDIFDRQSECKYFQRKKRTKFKCHYWDSNKCLCVEARREAALLYIEKCDKIIAINNKHQQKE